MSKSLKANALQHNKKPSATTEDELATSNYSAEDDHADMDTQAKASNIPDLSFLRSSNPAVQRAGLTPANVLSLQRTIGNRAVSSLIQRTKVTQTIQRRGGGNRLYVGNLSFSTTQESLEAAFASVGIVREVVIPTDRETGQSRGFAFVTMGSAEASNSAIGVLNGSMLDGRAIKVNEAQERMGAPSESGGRGGGGGRGGSGGGRERY